MVSSLYANSLPAFQESSHFCVNILAYDQIELSNHFAKSIEDKFDDVDHIIPESGAPVLIGSAAHFDCRNEFRHYGGDHIIFIGHVERFAYTDKPTLMFCRGKYIRGEPIMQTRSSSIGPSVLHHLCREHTDLFRPMRDVCASTVRL